MVVPVVHPILRKILDPPLEMTTGSIQSQIEVSKTKL